MPLSHDLVSDMWELFYFLGNHTYNFLLRIMATGSYCRKDKCCWQFITGLYVHVSFEASCSNKPVWFSLSLSVGSSAKILYEIIFKTCTAAEDVGNDIDGTSTADWHSEGSSQSAGDDHIIYFYLTFMK